MRVHPAQSLRLCDSVVTVGAFAGVHRGQQAMIRRALVRAAQLGIPSVAYHFGAPNLTSRPEKISRMEALGLNHAMVADFDAAYTARSAKDFLEKLADLNAVEIRVGPNFRFGHVQAGHVEMLGRRFATRVFEPVQCPAGGEIISSGRACASVWRCNLGNIRTSGDGTVDAAVSKGARGGHGEEHQVQAASGELPPPGAPAPHRWCGARRRHLAHPVQPGGRDLVRRVVRRVVGQGGPQLPDPFRRGEPRAFVERI